MAIPIVATPGDSLVFSNETVALRVCNVVKLSSWCFGAYWTGYRQVLRQVCVFEEDAACVTQKYRNALAVAVKRKVIW